MNGEAAPARGEVWWILADKRRPALVVQSDKIRERRVRTYLVVPLTTRLHLLGLPGTVRLDEPRTGLSKPSVANVYDVQKVILEDFIERSGTLPPESMREIENGLRLVLDL